MTDHSVGIRWTMSEAVMQSCHTAQAKDFALNLAQGSNVYYHLTDPRARYDWVVHNALYADQHTEAGVERTHDWRVERIQRHRRIGVRG